MSASSASGHGFDAPIFIIAPSIVASFVYVFVFAGWTFYISLSDSTLLPSYGFKGLDNYVSLWTNRRWSVAYNNLLSITQASIAQSRVSFVLGVLGVHALMLLILGALFYRRLVVFSVFRLVRSGGGAP